MEKARKFFRLPAAERRALLAAFWWVDCARVGLWLLPYSTLQKFLPSRVRPRQSPSLPRLRGDGAAASAAQACERLLWAIAVASRTVPHATCLTRALAARTLLARAGYDSTLRVGVAKQGARLDAHAWLECNGVAVLGCDERARFVALPALETEKA